MCVTLTKPMLCHKLALKSLGAGDSITSHEVVTMTVAIVDVADARFVSSGPMRDAPSPLKKAL